MDNYTTLEELIANVDLGTLAQAALDGSLQRWLEEHLYYDIAQALDVSRVKELDSDQLRLALCEELSVDLMSLSDYDARAVERALARRRKKIICIDPDSTILDGEIVENQAQLLNALTGGRANIIFLCGGEFQIPLSKHSITYIGRDNAVVNVTSRTPVSFDATEIVLENVTVRLRYLAPDDVEINRSHNIKIVTDKTLGNDPRRRDIYRFLQGRNPFETRDEYIARARSMTEIVVGEAVLEPSDFNVDNNTFEIRPRWHADFIEPVKKFVGNKFVSFVVEPHVAKKIFDSERVQFIFADFTSDGTLPEIETLFLETETIGKVILCTSDKPPAWLVFDTDIYAASGSGGGSGYGLELIAPTDTDEPINIHATDLDTAFRLSFQAAMNAAFPNGIDDSFYKEMFVWSTEFFSSITHYKNVFAFDTVFNNLRYSIAARNGDMNSYDRLVKRVLRAAKSAYNSGYFDAGVFNAELRS